MLKYIQISNVDDVSDSDEDADLVSATNELDISSDQRSPIKNMGGEKSTAIADDIEELDSERPVPPPRPSRYNEHDALVNEPSTLYEWDMKGEHFVQYAVEGTDKVLIYQPDPDEFDCKHRYFPFISIDLF